MQNIVTYFTQIVTANSPQDWLLAALAFVFTFTVLPLLRGFVRRTARSQDVKARPLALALMLELIQHTSRLFRVTVALYLAEKVLTLPGRADRVFEMLIVLSFWFQVGLWLMTAVRFGLERRTAAGQDRRLAGTINIVLFVASLVVWSVVVLVALGNLGVNITALVAGLGVGGIAIALAVQTVLSDLFASVSIALDKPFGLGDLLQVQGCEGTVEQIGIKSTRLRSVTGEQISISNAELLKSQLRNLGRMNERRALFSVNVAYETPEEKLDEVPKIVAAAVAKAQDTRYVHCMLKELGQFALVYEVVFFVPHLAGNELTASLEIVNRGIVRGFSQAGIKFAYPTRTLHMSQL
jgi:small-conductance mechanosensitive channel